MRILCFHGFGTNKTLLDYQLRQFKKFFKDIEFVTFNGPVDIDRSSLGDPALIALLEKTGQKSYSWFRILHENAYVYYDQTVNYVLNFMNKEGPFDGFLGFSQGGTLAAYMAYYCEYMRFIKNDLNVFQPKFAILIHGGGFFPPRFKEKFMIDVPSIHFIGENDFLFMKGLFTTSLFKEPIILFSKEGHKIPKLTENEINILKEFFKKNDSQKNNKIKIKPKL